MARHLGKADTEHDGHIGDAKLENPAFTIGARGFNMRGKAKQFVTLRENFAQLPALASGTGSRILVSAATGAGPTAAQFLAALLANVNFAVAGTNMTTALATYATGTGRIPRGGIEVTTAGADADQAIVLPLLTTAATMWAVGAWRTDRAARFEAWLRTGGQQMSVTNTALTSNVVTVTTGTTHNLSIGQWVTVAAVTQTTINGTFRVASIPSTTTFTYALALGDIGSGADTGTVTLANQIQNLSSAKLTNTVLTSNVVTMTTDREHGFAIGQTVTVKAITQTTVNGTFVITALPSPTKFSYALVLANISTGADTGTVTTSIPNSGINQAAITNTALTTNVVTITTGTTHGLAVGQTVKIAAVTQTTINGSFVVATVPSTTTFTYALTLGNIGSGADTGTVIWAQSTCNVLFQRIWAGLKLTNTDAIATDDDQFFARFVCTENGSQWQIITSRANVDVITVLPGVVTPDTLYHFVFNISETGIPSVYLNGTFYNLDGASTGQTGAAGNAALVTAKSFIPYVGTSANGTTPGTKAIQVLEEAIQAIAA